VDVALHLALMAEGFRRMVSEGRMVEELVSEAIRREGVDQEQLHARPISAPQVRCIIACIVSIKAQSAYLVVAAPVKLTTRLQGKRPNRLPISVSYSNAMLT
jgi:hypothetical protein